MDIGKKMRIVNWEKFVLEFVSIFIAVISAFALNNWNENRKDSITENKILIEIENGLEKDIEDVKINIGGHNSGISACAYFRKAIAGNNVKADSVMIHFFNLTRDYISIQNIAGYETLKSKGLELIKNDSLRSEIISLYEYDYNILRKFEEEYSEMQFQDNYYKDINNALAPNFKIDNNGMIIGINSPLIINQNERNKLLLHLSRIESNRFFILQYYAAIEKKINNVRKDIHLEIKH